MIRKSYRQLSTDYINITKQLPSTNPIRSPTPDIYSRKERICSTQSPGPQLTDRTNRAKGQSYHQSASKVDESQKDQQIQNLIEENRRLQGIIKEKNRFSKVFDENNR